MTKLALDLSDQSVAGNVTTIEVFVSVDWKWLVLPITLEVAGILLLLVAVILSRRRRVRLWRSSLLAILYHGLDDQTLNARDASPDIAGLEETARLTAVRMTWSDDDQPLMFRT